MNNEQQIVELAKKLRGHAWLARFRKADDKKNNYAHLSDQACNDIAGYVDELLDLIDPPQPVDWESFTPTPAPIELKYEVAVVTHPFRDSCVAIKFAGGDAIRIGSNEHYWNYDDVEAARACEWTFGPWHSHTVTH